MIDPDSTSSLLACVSGVNSKLFVRAPGGDHKGLIPVVDGVRYGAFAWSVDDVGDCRGSLVVGPVVLVGVVVGPVVVVGVVGVVVVGVVVVGVVVVGVVVVGVDVVVVGVDVVVVGVVVVVVESSSTVMVTHAQSSSSVTD